MNASIVEKEVSPRVGSIATRRLVGSLTLNTLLAVICLAWTLPTVGVLITSFRDPDQVSRTGWWTAGKDEKGFTLDNYRRVLVAQDYSYENAAGETVTLRGESMLGSFLNSLAVTIPSVLIPILLAAYAAYGFAWLTFPGRKILFVGIVAILAVPLQIALIPILRDYQKIGLNGTWLGIWLAHAGFGLPLATYLFYNYISTLPRSILESAFIDGASHYVCFTRLILPLAVPALASFAIFQFLWVWNDLLVALVFLSGGGKAMEVLTQRLLNLAGTRGQDWHLLTAGAFVSLILPLAVFFGLQKYFVRGLLAGSVKG